MGRGLTPSCSDQSSWCRTTLPIPQLGDCVQKHRTRHCDSRWWRLAVCRESAQGPAIWSLRSTAAPDLRELHPLSSEAAPHPLQQGQRVCALQPNSPISILPISILKRMETGEFTLFLNLTWSITIGAGDTDLEDPCWWPTQEGW